MKKLLSVILCIVFIFILTIFVFADIQPYGNVTEDTSQVKILIEAMLNDDNFDFRSTWVCFRESEYSYIIYFNYSENAKLPTKYYRYSAINSGYNSVWRLSSGYTNNIQRIDNSQYTVVGNGYPSSLGSSLFRNFSYQKMLIIAVPGIFVIFIYFVFRVRKRGRSI